MLKGIIRFANTRSRYGTFGCWLKAAYNRILRRLSFPLPFRGSTQRVFLQGEPAPFFVRLGTSDFLVLEEIYFNGEYEAIIPSLQESINLIVDLGANVGYSLLYWSKHFPNAYIIAVEPDYDNAFLCKTNVEHSGLSASVQIHVACVGARSRNVNLINISDAWAIQMEECKPGVTGEVRVITVPQLLAGFPETQEIDLLKCDIEGAEAELFGDCSTWIKRVRNIVVELHLPYTTEAFLSALEACGAGFVVNSVTKHGSLPVIFLSRRAP
jgi:FkbM family methyltransferase